MKKFTDNIARDGKHVGLLRDRGWRVAIVWECALKRSVEDVAKNVGAWLQGSEAELTID